MEGEAPSRRGGVNSIISGSFSGFLGGYPRISQGPRSRSGEDEDEEEEDSVEEEDSEENEVAAALAGAPEASEASNLALPDKPLVSKADGEYDSIHGSTH
ncbi:hypothetical protein O181_061441 [Austropuccinia psidii MF-1]|uniref:Uncharacterized protein n=1 Tax=Austropuccinia psidii MF-1 TaxID=1389203 RepID=A0A9Q3HXI2_9BASI|nr:hypothetical protein [Austropuccinia psidii MF-1]